MFVRLRWLVSTLALSAAGETLATKTRSDLIDPINSLREKGLTSDDLDEILVGLRGGDGCFCSLAVRTPRYYP